MVGRDILRLLGKALFLCSPILLLVLAYVAWDPFLVLRRHDQYYPGEVGVSPNRDYVSTELLRAQGPSWHYDAFIFGNSRSSAFETATWAHHLPSGRRPFHYDASLESLYGIWAKLRYLDSNGYDIRNALLIVDGELLGHGTNVEDRALYRKHPALLNESPLSFQLASFEAFLSRLFFFKYADYRLFGHWRDYMGGTLERRSMVHEKHTNDLMFTRLEEEILTTGEDYYRRRAAVFDHPDPSAGTPMKPVLGAPERERLQDMKGLFERHDTDVRIVVSPLYDRRPLNRSDLQVLQDLFGTNNVYDYSGTNVITSDRHNYYEASHYRIAIAAKIMERMYAHAPVESR